MYALSVCIVARFQQHLRIIVSVPFESPISSINQIRLLFFHSLQLFRKKKIEKRNNREKAMDCAQSIKMWPARKCT